MLTRDPVDYLKECVAAGEVAIFQPEDSLESRTIPATVLRNLLLTQNAAVRVQGAFVEGALDLSDQMPFSAGSLPSLLIEDCDLPSPVRLSSTRINGLSIARSRFRELDVSYAQILGRLDFSDVAPYSDPSLIPAPGVEPVSETQPYLPTAMIRGNAVQVQGVVLGSNARLQAQPARDKAEPGKEIWALDLSMSRISGSINLSSSDLRGGIKLDASIVEGDIWCLGTKSTKGEADAFKLQEAHVSGALFLQDAKLDGTLWMRTARFAEVYLFNTEIIASSGAFAVVADFIRVDGNVTFASGFKAIGGPVSLDGSHIGGNLTCSDARFESVPLTSRVPPNQAPICFSAAGIKVEGQVEIVKADSDAEARETCIFSGHVSFSGAEIGRSFYVQDAWLRSRSSIQQIDWIDQSLSPIERLRLFQYTSALDLSGAKIGLDVTFAGVEAEGTLLLNSAQIGASLLLANCKVLTRAAIFPSVDAAGLKVGRSIKVGGKPPQKVGDPANSLFRGTFSLAGAQVEQAVEFEVTRLDSGSRAEYAKALDLSASEIGGEVLLKQTDVLGLLDLSSASVGGDVRIERGRLKAGSPQARMLALDLQAARLARGLSLERIASVEGQVRMNFAAITGPVYIHGCRLHAGRNPQDKEPCALKAVSASFGGDLTFGDATSDLTPEATELLGAVHLSRSQVSGVLRLQHCALRMEEENATGTVLLGQGMHINGAVEFGPALQVAGTVDLSESLIQGNARCIDTTFSSTGDAPAFIADRLSVGGNLIFDHGSRFLGSLHFPHADIKANLEWTGLQIGDDSISSQRAKALRFDLKHVKIGGALRAIRLQANQLLIIDLRSASAQMLEDDIDKGWGSFTSEGSLVKVRLESFQYQLLQTGERNASGPKDEWFDKRIAWLQFHQHADEYHPYAFQQLATQLQAQGFESFSRDVSIAQRNKGLAIEWGESSVWKKLFILAPEWCFGFFFGFGFSPARALTTLTVLLVIGVCGSSYAGRSGTLVQTPSKPSEDKSSDNKSDQGSAPLSHAAASPCGGIEDSIVNALNLALPLVQLPHKTACEIVADPHHPGLAHSPAFWHASEDGYSILAKLCSSLALLTFSGVLRRPE